MAGMWRRKGLLDVQPVGGWWASHAQFPTVLSLSDRLWRIYFAGRNSGNQASILAVDVDPRNNMRVVGRYLTPLLPRGPLGSFDHFGLAPSCVLMIDGLVHLYYTGLSVRRDVRFQLAIGLAVSSDGLAFEKLFEGPVRATGPFDPYFVSAPCVRRYGAGYCMWHVSGVSWGGEEGQSEPLYTIRSCRSADGVIWSSSSELVLPNSLPNEAALGRPWISEEPGGLRLWYCRRGTTFRGSAPGAYRLASRLLDPAGVASGEAELVHFQNAPSDGDFDQHMQAYPCVVDFEEGQVMFYNGDDFGAAGIGWAVRDGDNFGGLR